MHALEEFPGLRPRLIKDGFGLRPRVSQERNTQEKRAGTCRLFLALASRSENLRRYLCKRTEPACLVDLAPNVERVCDRGPERRA
jgi:hypothetical protein